MRAKIMNAIFFRAIAVAAFGFLLLPSFAFAQDETPQVEMRGVQTSAEEDERMEAVITSILEQKVIDTPEGAQNYQKLELVVTSGSEKGKSITIESGIFQVSGIPTYAIGDKVVVYSTVGPAGEPNYYITDYNRKAALFWLLAFFVLVTIAVARWQGFTSLVGMAFSFAVIFLFMLPRLASGADPLWTAIIGAVIIVPPTFALAHGLSRKTLVAVIGTVISFLLAGLLVAVFVTSTRLTGYSSEDIGLLQALWQGSVDARGLLLAGVIISLLGVFDDVTVAQSSVVEQIHEADPRLGFFDLYRRAMKVGKDHIASMVNTLVLVYAGASLPTLILFSDDTHSFGEVLNMEQVTEEIVRALVGSSGLILAVPITTLIACWWLTRKH